MKECEYPNCEKCVYPDCVMDKKDLDAMRMRKWRRDHPSWKTAQNFKRQQIRDSLPNCENCPEYVEVRQDRADGAGRLCIKEMRLISRQVSHCPQWCPKRGNDALHRNYLTRVANR